MINDREYMRNKKSKLDTFDPVKCVYWLIAANVFMYYIIAPPGGQGSNYQRLALNASEHSIGTVFRLVTAMFLHSSFNHLFFNMFGIYMFGRFVAPRLGTKRFIQFFIVSGVAGNLLWLASNMNSQAGLVGASGGVFGILVATALLEPNMKVMLLIPPIPMKMKTLVIVYGILEIFYTLTGIQDSVANLAHLGGLIGGYIMIRYIFRMPVWDLFQYMFGKQKTSQKKKKPFKAPAGWSVNKKTTTKKQDVSDINITIDEDAIQDTTVHVPQKEMDRILDKISENGIKNLTAEELNMLKNARNKMKQ